MHFIYFSLLTGIIFIATQIISSLASGSLLRLATESPLMT